MLLEKFKSGQAWYQGLGVVPGLRETAKDLVAASFAINALSLAVPLTLMQVYDRIIPYQSNATLTWFVLACAVAVLTEGVLRLFRAQISAWGAARFEHLVGMAAMEKMLTSSLADFERSGLGVHLDRMNAVATLRSFYSGQVFQVILDLPFALLFVVIVWYLGGIVVLVPLVMIGLYFVLVRVVKRNFEAARGEQVTTNDRRFNYVIELLGGVHLLKSQSMEEQMLRRYERLQASTATANMNVGYWSSLPTTIGASFSLVTMFGVIAVGGGEVINGRLTLGGLAACMLLAGRALSPIQSAAGFWVRFSNAEIARNRLGEIADIETEIAEGTPEFPSDIDGWVRLKNVSFRYNDEQDNIVDDVTIDIEPHQMIGLLGKSSSGTSTLMSLILGRTKPDSGNILIDDYDVNEWDVSNLTGRIEYVSQSGTLFKGSVLDNIAVFDPKMHDAALDAAGLLGLDELIAILPQGYETQVDTQASNFLSSGLIQRICIARALAVKPRILILDKTDASMDSESRELFEWLIRRVKGVCTVIVITNQIRLLRECDRVLELFYGKLVDKDPNNPEVRLNDASALFDDF